MKSLSLCIFLVAFAMAATPSPAPTITTSGVLGGLKATFYCPAGFQCFYTNDGSLPSPSAIPFVTGLELEFKIIGPTSLKAFSCVVGSDAFDPSPLVEVDFDLPPGPTPEITISENSATLTCPGDDVWLDAECYYTIDGTYPDATSGIYFNTASPVTIAAGEAAFPISVISLVMGGGSVNQEASLPAATPPTGGDCSAYDQDGNFQAIMMPFKTCLDGAPFKPDGAAEMCACLAALEAETSKPEHSCLDLGEHMDNIMGLKAWLPCPNPVDADTCKAFHMAESVIMDEYRECFREAATFQEECPCFDAVRDKARLFPLCPMAQLLEKRAIGRKVDGGVCPKPDMATDLNWCGKHHSPCRFEDKDGGVFVRDEIVVDQEGFGFHQQQIMDSCDAGAGVLKVKEMVRLYVKNMGSSTHFPGSTRFAIVLVDSARDRDMGDKEYNLNGEPMFMLCEAGAAEGDLLCNRGDRWRKRGWFNPVQYDEKSVMKRVEACTASFPAWKPGFVEDIKETAAAAHEVYNLNHSPRRWRIQMEKKRQEFMNEWNDDRKALFEKPFEVIVA